MTAHPRGGRCSHCGFQFRLDPGRLCLSCWSTTTTVEADKAHTPLCECWVRDLRGATIDAILNGIAVAEHQDAP